MSVLTFLPQNQLGRYVALTFGEIQVIIATRFLKRISAYTLELRTFVHNTFLLYLPFFKNELMISKCHSSALEAVQITQPCSFPLHKNKQTYNKQLLLPILKK